MGSLRFRKSIRICKGVRLNVGKTGVSISAGIPGFRKTIHTTGRVTTSVGIPGSGLYYVDTKNIKKKETSEAKKLSGQNHNCSETSNSVIPSEAKLSEIQSYSDGIIQETRDDLHRNIEASPISSVTVSGAEEKVKSQKEPFNDRQENLHSYIEFIFNNCDMPVNWMDVISHRKPTSFDYDEESWFYLHKMAAKVFEEDTDAYLDIINTINPFDDLLDYAKDFVVGISESGLEIELTLLNGKIVDALSSDVVELYHALSIRTARDTFALLPIEEVRVTVLNEKEELLVKLYKRDSFQKLDFDILSPTQIVDLC